MSADRRIMAQRHRFVKAIAAALADRCGVGPGERLVVAVSGGADSTALARALAALGPRREWSLDVHIAHVNHHLRPAADADEAFVRRLAEGLGVPFYRADIAPAGAAGNVESNARRLRYEALGRIARQVEADAVATAHHADDQLETMLMRLIRGASAGGLSGMAPRRRLVNGCALVRPMLWCDRAGVVAFLRDVEQPWREDATNVDLSRSRARLRAEALPVLRRLRADAAVKASESADRLREAAALLGRAARRAERRHVRMVSAGEAAMQREAARRMAPALLTAVIRRRCRAMGVGADALGHRVTDPIVRAARDGSGETRRFELAGGVRVEVTGGEVRWSRDC